MGANIGIYQFRFLKIDRNEDHLTRFFDFLVLEMANRLRRNLSSLKLGQTHHDVQESVPAVQVSAAILSALTRFLPLICEGLELGKW